MIFCLLCLYLYTKQKERSGTLLTPFECYRLYSTFDNLQAACCGRGQLRNSHCRVKDGVAHNHDGVEDKDDDDDDGSFRTCSIESFRTCSIEHYLALLLTTLRRFHAGWSESMMRAYDILTQHIIESPLFDGQELHRAEHREMLAREGPLFF